MSKVQPLPRDLYPADLLMVGHWAMALKVALSNKDIMKSYRRDTKDEFKPNLLGVDLLNESTGSEREFLIRFINWFNPHIWGNVEIKAGQ